MQVFIKLVCYILLVDMENHAICYIGLFFLSEIKPDYKYPSNFNDAVSIRIHKSNYFISAFFLQVLFFGCLLLLCFNVVFAEPALCLFCYLMALFHVMLVPVYC